jgi:hypothetical protein
VPRTTTTTEQQQQLVYKEEAREKAREKKVPSYKSFSEKLASQTD